MLELLGLAVGIFAGTNIDDLLVLTVLFLSSRSRAPIWVGQYLGIAALVVVSAAVALGLAVVPDRWIGLLGLVPLALGIRGLLSRSDGETPLVARGFLPVAGVTIANGADNISVYAPIFRTVGMPGSLVIVGVFAALVAVWCLAGSWLGSHPKVVTVVSRWGHWIVPAVFIVIGLVILLTLL